MEYFQGYLIVIITNFDIISLRIPVSTMHYSLYKEMSALHQLGSNKL